MLMTSSTRRLPWKVAAVQSFQLIDITEEMCAQIESIRFREGVTGRVVHCGKKSAYADYFEFLLDLLLEDDSTESEQLFYYDLWKDGMTVVSDTDPSCPMERWVIPTSYVQSDVHAWLEDVVVARVKTHAKQHYFMVWPLVNYVSENQLDSRESTSLREEEEFAFMFGIRRMTELFYCVFKDLRYWKFCYQTPALPMIIEQEEESQD